MSELRLTIMGQQAKKIKYLKEKGGKHLTTVVRIEMPDKRVATIDDWGRVTWQEPPTQPNTDKGE